MSVITKQDLERIKKESMDYLLKHKVHIALYHKRHHFFTPIYPEILTESENKNKYIPLRYSIEITYISDLKNGLITAEQLNERVDEDFKILTAIIDFMTQDTENLIFTSVRYQHLMKIIHEYFQQTQRFSAILTNLFEVHVLTSYYELEERQNSDFTYSIYLKQDYPYPEYPLIRDIEPHIIDSVIEQVDNFIKEEKQKDRVITIPSKFSNFYLPNIMKEYQSAYDESDKQEIISYYVDLHNHYFEIIVGETEFNKYYKYNQGIDNSVEYFNDHKYDYVKHRAFELLSLNLTIGFLLWYELNLNARLSFEENMVKIFPDGKIITNMGETTENLFFEFIKDYNIEDEWKPQHLHRRFIND